MVWRRGQRSDFVVFKSKVRVIKKKLYRQNDMFRFAFFKKMNLAVV